MAFELDVISGQLVNWPARRVVSHPQRKGNIWWSRPVSLALGHITTNDEGLSALVAGGFGGPSARVDDHCLGCLRAEPVGGQAAYITINGNSMEPSFHLGDLAIVRRESVYQIGGILQIML